MSNSLVTKPSEPVVLPGHPGYLPSDFRVYVYQEAAPTEKNWLYEIRQDGKKIITEGAWSNGSLALMAGAIRLQKFALAELQNREP